MRRNRNDATVLVVDDEPIIRKQMLRTLESVGISCHCAANGDEALRRIAGHQYELVVTDLRMPVRHGHALVMGLLYQLTPPKVVVLTGVMEPRMKVDLLARGVAAVVYKPVDYFKFAGSLKSLLSPRKSTLDKSDRSSAQASAAGRAQMSDCDKQLRRELEGLGQFLPSDNCWLTAAMQWIDWNKLPDPPIELMTVSRCRPCRSEYAASDRRRDRRVQMDEIAIAIELDSGRRPIGPPFKLVIRDLSQSGVRLVHTEKMGGNYFGLMWQTIERARAIAMLKAVRSRELNDFVEIGGRFISKFD